LDEVASITYAKNKEIGDMFNKQNALNMEIEQLTQQMQLYQEDAEIMLMIKDENQQLKKTVFEASKEKDELQAQISRKL
jgi:predicted regulator of Ras-like GTPase activity (Roadblock/LC7/MglB family)